jgi:hypothetical protein
MAIKVSGKGLEGFKVKLVFVSEGKLKLRYQIIFILEDLSQLDEKSSAFFKF